LGDSSPSSVKKQLLREETVKKRLLKKRVLKSNCQEKLLKIRERAP